MWTFFWQFYLFGAVLSVLGFLATLWLGRRFECLRATSVVEALDEKLGAHLEEDNVNLTAGIAIGLIGVTALLWPAFAKSLVHLATDLFHVVKVHLLGIGDDKN